MQQHQKLLIFIAISVSLYTLPWFPPVCFTFTPSPLSPKEFTQQARQILSQKSRYVAHVMLDKHIYRPGDTLRFRTILFDVVTLLPAPSRNLSSSRFTIVILGPNSIQVESEKDIHKKSDDLALTGGWTIPSGTPGGNYILQVKAKKYDFFSGERKFQIREYISPKMNGSISFTSKEYGPGDTVLAFLEVEKVESGVSEEAHVQIKAFLDGENIFVYTKTIDLQKNFSAEFSLPTSLKRGQGVLVYTVSSRSIVEKFSKTIPIVQKEFKIDFFPEGGNYVEAANNLVYFQTFSHTGEPVDFEGHLCFFQSGRCSHTNVNVSTFHEGRGKFSFLFNKGKYGLVVTKPPGISTIFDLSMNEQLGEATFSLTTSVLKPGEVLEGTIASSLLRSKISLVLSRKEREMASISLTLKNALQPFSFHIPLSILPGVLTITLLFYSRPLAERLVFIRPLHYLQIDARKKDGGEVEGKAYTPGERVEFTLQSLNEIGKPVPSLISVTVVDKSNSRNTEKRQRHPRLAEIILLENEVLEFRDPGYLEEGKDRELDLLLGVQGWRRFVYYEDINEFLMCYYEKGVKLLGAFPVHYAYAYNYAPYQICFSAFMREVKYLPYYNKFLLPGYRWHHPLNARYIPTGKEPKDVEVRGTGEKIEEEQKFQFMDPSPIHSIENIVGSWTYGREYSYRMGPNREHMDFHIETLYFATIQTNEARNASVVFDLPDSVTTFEILIDGIFSPLTAASSSENLAAFGECTLEFSSVGSL